MDLHPRLIVFREIPPLFIRILQATLKYSKQIVD